MYRSKPAFIIFGYFLLLYNESWILYLLVILNCGYFQIVEILISQGLNYTLSNVSLKPVLKIETLYSLYVKIVQFVEWYTSNSSNKFRVLMMHFPSLFSKTCNYCSVFTLNFYHTLHSNKIFVLTLKWSGYCAPLVVKRALWTIT